MSLITRCPACGTMFKVVTDQLKVSRGWVRCGHCTEVFDAPLYLRAAQSPVAVPRPVGPPVRHANVETKVETLPEPEMLLAAEPSYIAPDTLADVGDVRVAAETAPIESRESDRADSNPSLNLDPSSSQPDKSPVNDVSFVRDAQRQVFWRKPLVRFGLGLSGLLLAILLLLQFLVQQRNDLAALEPRLKPWLQRLCEPLQCEIAALRHIEAVLIDSSSFNKINGEAYRLSFSLKNTGTVPVAMPSLEVTLTDSQEKVLVRRVVAPAQFGAADGGVLPGAGSEFSGAVVMQFLGGEAQGTIDSTPLVTAQLRLAGYRVLAFYP